MKNIIRFIGVNKDTTTAGPGKRLELFTKGCIRGVVSPCDGCFNKTTWTFEGNFRPMTVEEVISICDRDAWNRQVTFCGGEPIIQGRNLMKVARELKRKDPTFHFVMYTSYKLDVLMKVGLNFTWRIKDHEKAMFEQLKEYSYSYEIIEYEDKNPSIVKFIILTPEEILELMEYIDLIVDGDFQLDKRLTTHRFMHDGGFVGSSNQRVIFSSDSIKKNDFLFMYADKFNQYREHTSHCDTCGKEVSMKDNYSYCNKLCERRHVERISFFNN